MLSRPTALLLLLFACCQSQDSARRDGVSDARRWELDRVGGTAVVQLYADGFDELAKNDKLLAFHLTQAAIAGRDITLDQRFALNLPIRYVLESLWLTRDALPPAVRAEVERYTKLFWVHNGIHHNLSTKKELLALDHAQFFAAIRTAAEHGQPIPPERLAPAKDLEQIFAVLTDPHRDLSVTDKSPEGGADPVAASCNNLYVGCTTADFEGFHERYGLNSRAVKEGGKVVEQVYRCGDGKAIPPGFYAREIAVVNTHLRDALAVAPPPTQKALERLIRYNETGEEEDWRAFNIAWVQDRASVVDFALGFIEVYLDVRGIKGSWQAVISFRNEQKTRAIEALARETQWFEDRQPWEPRFRKAEVKGISARAISVITETGDCGPITPVGVNLPNEADIRQQYGSKSVNIANVV